VFDVKAYCKQLVAFYDRYGASRTENADGRRKHTRIGADIDCKEGNWEDGVAAMIKLLESKRFEVPPTLDTAHQLPPENEKGARRSRGISPPAGPGVLQALQHDRQSTIGTRLLMLTVKLWRAHRVRGARAIMAPTTCRKSCAFDLEQAELASLGAKRTPCEGPSSFGAPQRV
jgi:hypothetical protein